MSAIREEGADAEPIKVLFTLHNNMNALDFVGPLEVLSMALHDTEDDGRAALDACTSMLTGLQKTKPSTASSLAQARMS